MMRRRHSITHYHKFLYSEQRCRTESAEPGKSLCPFILDCGTVPEWIRCRGLTADYETHREWTLRTSPTNWQTFPGSTKPSIKTKDDWWNNPEFVKWEPFSSEEQTFVDTLEKVGQVAMKSAPSLDP
jgi:hypothetical protein